MSQHENKYFPASYDDARNGFCKALTRHGFSHQSWHVPSQSDNDLTVDLTYLPPLDASERLYVILSGVHGLEGYAGSAIQQMLLSEHLPRADRRRSGYLLLHSLNPYGFKNHRRNTENNVNLNRNCSAGTALYHLKNDESVLLSERFIPRKKVESETSLLLASLRFEKGKPFFAEVSLDQLTKTVGLGQFHTPDALEFGGHGPEPQVQKLVELLKKLVPLYKDIVLFDLHTGLGDRGRLHLLTGDGAESLDSKLFSELLTPEKEKSIYHFTQSEEEGFYRTNGATNNLLPELARPDQRICALTLEFGTLGHDLQAQLKGFNGWLLEHQGSLYGYESGELEARIKADYLERFYPADPEWARSVIATARAFFERAL